MINKIMIIIIFILSVSLFQFGSQHKIEEITPKEYDELIDEGYNYLEIFSVKDYYQTEEDIVETFLTSGDVAQNYKDDFINGRLTFTVIIFVQINYGMSYWIQIN